MLVTEKVSVYSWEVVTIIFLEHLQRNEKSRREKKEVQDLYMSACLDDYTNTHTCSYSICKDPKKAEKKRISRSLTYVYMHRRDKNTHTHTKAHTDKHTFA